MILWGSRLQVKMRQPFAVELRGDILGGFAFDLLALNLHRDRLFPVAQPKPTAINAGVSADGFLVQGFEGIPRVELPPGINATLRAYQEVGVDWLSFLRDAELGAVLADDMGLGKTLQTICVLRGRTLVVCPKSVVYNWADEIVRLRPQLRTAIYHGNKRELDLEADVTLTTYAVLRLDVELLSNQTWDVVVLDEAQAIKNESSQTARAG